MPLTKYYSLVEPVANLAPKDPCRPSPCGPNSHCRSSSGLPSCSCLLGFIGQPPQCRPECTSSTDCANNLACIQQKCTDPCPGQCGTNARCHVVSHAIQCICLDGFQGDPFVQCTTPKAPETIRELLTPCNPSPCGANANCREQNNVGACQCFPGYLGNPYEGCRPECTLNSDCPSNQACQQQKCRDPCPGVCGANAECSVINHLPTCNCLTEFTGDPYRFCSRIERSKI